LGLVIRQFAADLLQGAPRTFKLSASVDL